MRFTGLSSSSRRWALGHSGQVLYRQGVGLQPSRRIPLRRKILTVYSPKGGTGCTTVAVNLSLALQSLLGPEARICLVDGNLQFGDVSISMKLQPSRTLAESRSPCRRIWIPIC